MLIAWVWLSSGLFWGLAQTVPYAPDEVGKLRAFLECSSMVTGKNNAEVLGANLDDPATWPGVMWVDYDPFVDSNLPKVRLPFKHAHAIDLRSTLAGTLDISGFPYLQLCWIMNTPGNVGIRGKYSSIRVSNNPKCTSVYLDYLEAGSVEIGGNPSLSAVHFQTSDIRLLNLSAPSLWQLNAGTLGEPPLNFAAYPELQVLTLAGVANVTTLDLSGCPNLEGLSVSDMKNLREIRWGGVQNLQHVALSDNPFLASLDVRQAIKLGYLEVTDHDTLTNLMVGRSPSLKRVRVTGNPSLASLVLSDLPSLDLADCSNNNRLRQLILQGNPQLTVLRCEGNTLESLDTSGLPALKWLYAAGNELTQFRASSSPLINLSLGRNKLQSIEANVGGHTIRATAYRGGGYVNLDATDSAEDPSRFFMSFDAEGLPEPRNTKLLRTEGSGLPAGYSWKDRFPLTGNVDATLYFGAVVVLMSYYERVEDNPWGELFETAYPIVPTVGDPIGPLNPPARKGFRLQGWYTDEELTQPWDLELDVLEGEMTLFPNWVPDGAPMVLSIQRLDPSNERVSAHRVVFRVRFNEVVSGVDPADFTLSSDGTASGRVASVSANHGDTVDVVVDQISGSGTLRLDLKATGTQIADANGVPLTGGYTQGESYRVGSSADQALASFLQAHGIDPTSAGGAPHADPDKDGLSNLLEFVLGANPSEASAQGKPVAEHHASAATPAFEYHYRVATEAEVYFRIVVDYSADLAHWTPASSGQDGVAVTSQVAQGSREVTVTFPAAGQRLFVRLRLEAK